MERTTFSARERTSRPRSPEASGCNCSQAEPRQGVVSACSCATCGALPLIPRRTVDWTGLDALGRMVVRVAEPSEIWARRGRPTALQIRVWAYGVNFADGGDLFVRVRGWATRTLTPEVDIAGPTLCEWQLSRSDTAGIVAPYCVRRALRWPLPEAIVLELEMVQSRGAGTQFAELDLDLPSANR